jgi:hypothetical protein
MTKTRVFDGPLAFSKDLKLPIDAATQTFAFLGRRGSGKTYGAGKLIELLLAAGVQVVILDTVGNWYGLRLAADGKKKGFDIPVIGGLRGDVPLEEGAGALVADTLIETGRSAILDVSQFSLAARQRFATAFGERLWMRKKGDHHPSPMTLVLEEAQLIVPQNFQSAQARMVGIFEEIVRLGRNYGIGAVMISQRPQSVNKEVLTQTECLCVFQTNGRQERDALKKWIVSQGASVDLVEELPALPVGTAYVWSPQWLGIFQRLTIAEKQTFDSSATPKVGVKRPAARELAPLDLQDLSERMRDVVERQKNEDPKALRKRVAELELELSRKRKPAVPKTERVEVPVMDAKTRAACDRIMKRLVERDKAISLLEEEVRALLERVDARVKQTAPPMSLDEAAEAGLSGLAGLSTHLQPDKLKAWRERANARIAELAKRGEATARANANAELGAIGAVGERKILAACAQAGGADRTQLTVLTGYKRRTRDTYLHRLRSRGLIAESDGRIVATVQGLAELGDNFERLPTGDKLREYWLERLPQGEREVLRAIANAYPKPASRETLSQYTGYKRRTRDTYVHRLSARMLVVAEREGVRARPELFG